MPQTHRSRSVCVGCGAGLGSHMETIRHYWGAYKLSHINNTRMGALREMLFKPF